MLRLAAGLIFATGALAGHPKYGYGHAKAHGGKTHAKPVEHETILIPECPEGFIRKGGYCVQGGTVPKEETCPSQSVNDGGMCLLTLDGTPVCESGVGIGDLFCEIKDVVNSHLACPEGSVDRGDQCFVGGLVDYCPAGSARAADGRCITTVAKEFFCPPHLKDAGNVCVDYDYAEVIELCPEDTELINGECIAEIEREPVCPKGFADEGSACAVYEAPVRDVCPEGYYFDADELSCTKTTSTPSTPQCPDGGYLTDGKCQKVVPGPTAPVCDTGILIEGLCHVQSVAAPEFECPAGYDLESTPKGPICTQSIPYDCSEVEAKCAPPRPGTPMPYKKGSKGGKADLYHRKLGHYGHDGKSHKYGYCEKIETIVHKTCYETITAEAIPVCPTGSVWDGCGGCIVKDVFPPEEKCIAEVTPEGACVIVEYYMPVYYCPAGFVPIGNGSECEVVDVIEPEVRCPENTELFQGKCAVFVEKTCPGAGCLETLTWVPEPTCPVDYTLILFDVSKGHKYVSHERRCVREIFSAPSSTCPEGYFPLDEESCGAYTPAVVIDEQVSVPPQEICPIGFAAVKCGDRCDSFYVCEQTGYAPAELVCPEGYYPIAGTEICGRHVGPVDVCPKGAKEVDGECVIAIKTQPIYIEEPALRVPYKKGHSKGGFKKGGHGKW